MDQLFRIILYLFLFLAATGSFVAAARGSNVGQKKARRTLTMALFAGVVGGAAVGALVGILSPVQHGSLAGAAGFGTAGLFGGMIVALRWIGTRQESQANPPAKVTVAGIAIGGAVGALVGLWLPVFVADLEAPFMFSFVCALAGVAAGALLGFTWEQPLIGGSFTALFLLSGVIGVTVGWLQDTDAERPEPSRNSTSSAAPRPTIWDQMYDRQQLLADLTSDKPGTPLQAVLTLWLLIDGGPQFHRPDQPDSPTLREVFAKQESVSGIWTAEIQRQDQRLLLEFNFAADSDELILTVHQTDGTTTIDRGTVKVNGTEITFSNDRGTLSLSLAGYQPK